MKIKNFIVDDEKIFTTFKKFMSFEMYISTMYKVEPLYRSFSEHKNKVYEYKFKIYEKYACPVFDTEGKLVKYVVDGCSQENKDLINEELNILMNGEFDFEKIKIDMSTVKGFISREDFDILRIFFDLELK